MCPVFVLQLTAQCTHVVKRSDPLFEELRKANTLSCDDLWHVEKCACGL
jgi:hypothetical protein